jgi:hypothetical protein
MSSEPVQPKVPPPYKGNLFETAFGKFRVMPRQAPIPECNHGDAKNIHCDKDTCFATRGLSARFMEAILRPLPLAGYSNHPQPWDLDDFKRCVKLYLKNPSWDIQALRKYKNWEPLVNNWTELVSMYHDGFTDTLNARIRALVRDM